MNLYSIYIDNKNEAASPTIIRQGFAVWPVILNFLWGIYHKMWLLVTAIIVLTAVVLVYEDLNNMNTVLQFFVFAFFATDIREYYAEKNGLKLDDIILARNVEEAEVKYLSRKNVDAEYAR